MSFGNTGIKHGNAQELRLPFTSGDGKQASTPDLCKCRKLCAGPTLQKALLDYGLILVYGIMSFSTPKIVSAKAREKRVCSDPMVVLHAVSC